MVSGNLSTFAWFAAQEQPLREAQRPCSAPSFIGGTFPFDREPDFSAFLESSTPPRILISPRKSGCDDREPGTAREFDVCMPLALSRRPGHGKRQCLNDPASSRPGRTGLHYWWPVLLNCASASARYKTPRRKATRVVTNPNLPRIIQWPAIMMKIIFEARHQLRMVRRQRRRITKEVEGMLLK